MRRWILAVSLALFTLAGGAQAKRGDPGKFRVYTVDIGTGLCVFMEFPVEGQERPIRVVYDTGKGASEGTDNDLVSFLTSPKIGLKHADPEGEFQGEIIDYFILSHPHEDHYNGAKPLFESFDVRNIIESKQIHSVKYLKRFKGAAINEIAAAKKAGKDAHYYVVGLPYPNGFDKPRFGEPYDEYALCQKNLPEFMQGKIDCRAKQGEVTYPFGPEDVAQSIEWPVLHLMGEKTAAMKHVMPEFRETSLMVDLLPLGTRFTFDEANNAGFTLVHGDTIAAFDHAQTSRKTYAEAWPYYRESDLNDGSVSIQATFRKSSVFIPGDTEGRDKKPTQRFSLSDIFGSGEGAEAYTEDDVMKHLRWDKPRNEQLPLLEFAAPYVMGSEDLRRMAFHSIVTYDKLTPEEFPIKPPGGEQTIPANVYESPADLGEDLVFWERRSEVERNNIHPRWRERLFGLYDTLRTNSQKRTALKNRFRGWVKGKQPRIIRHPEIDRFVPEWKEPVWTITNLVQLAERIYYTEPYLSHILAGFIMSSQPFLDYIAPPDRKDWAKRGERHMLHVAGQIKEETGGEVDVIKSDVLFFGHHGSFTSSSLGFVLSVQPNVGIISADDKSYSGSTLPDFSALFWNLNTHHPAARAIFHSAFFHADILAERRGEPIDPRVKAQKFSHSVSKIFQTRRLRGGAIPIWRTDFNDDLIDKNVLVDNIVIETDGSKPIWEWARNPAGDTENRWKIPPDEVDMKYVPKYQYFFQALAFGSNNGRAIRPHDPGGEIATFQVRHRLPYDQDHIRGPDGHLIESIGTMSGDEDEDEIEDWADDEDDDDWVNGHHH